MAERRRQRARADDAAPAVHLELAAEAVLNGWTREQVIEALIGRIQRDQHYLAYRKACNRRTSYDNQVQQDLRALALAAVLLDETAPPATVGSVSSGSLRRERIRQEHQYEGDHHVPKEHQAHAQQPEVRLHECNPAGRGKRPPAGPQGEEGDCGKPQEGVKQDDARALRLAQARQRPGPQRPGEEAEEHAGREEGT
jgi:hypothetical protein